MRRRWTLSSVGSEMEGVRSPPWHCQLVHSEAAGDVLVLDLIALETCPSDAVGCPRDTPFSLHIGRGGPVDRDWDRELAAWTATADVVTIMCGVTGGGSAWLCLSSADRHLLLEV